MSIRRCIGIVLTCLLVLTGMVVPSSQADEQKRPIEASWENLGQLQVGQKIEVVEANMRSLQGTFLEFSDKTITVCHKEIPVSISRSNVARVSSRQQSKRLRNALIGLAIGGAAGIGVAAAVGKGDPEARAIYAVIAVPVGMGAGCALGAAFPGFQTIFRAKPVTKGQTRSMEGKGSGLEE